MILARIEAEIVLGTFEYERYFPKSARVEEFKQRVVEKAPASAGLPSFDEFVNLWFTECEVGWKYSYKTTIRGSLDQHLIPRFGDISIASITKADILAFRADLSRIRRSDGSEGLSPARINHILVPLRMALNEAAERYEFDSPFRNIKPLRVPKTQVDPFTLEEVNLILENVRIDFRNFYTVRFFTGMRTGEIHGLKWQYVDFERRQILVRESFVSGQMTDTKNDGSAREIQMSPPVEEALRRQHRVSGSGEFVFCAANGAPLSVNNVTKRVWYPILRYLGLKERRPYQSRHTTATLWLAAGEAPEWIARQMGHTSTEMLFKVYSRYVPNLTRRDGSAFNALLENRYTEPTKSNTNPFLSLPNEVIYEKE
jgi:integrase